MLNIPYVNSELVTEMGENINLRMLSAGLWHSAIGLNSEDKAASLLLQ
jgi:hypothetical protein